MSPVVFCRHCMAVFFWYGDKCHCLQLAHGHIGNEIGFITLHKKPQYQIQIQMQEKITYKNLFVNFYVSCCSNLHGINQ